MWGDGGRRQGAVAIHDAVSASIGQTPFVLSHGEKCRMQRSTITYRRWRGRRRLHPAGREFVAHHGGLARHLQNPAATMTVLLQRAAHAAPGTTCAACRQWSAAASTAGGDDRRGG